MDRKTTTFIKGILAVIAIGGLMALVPSLLPRAAAQSASTELAASSMDGGGGEMSGGSLSMDYAVAEGQPIGAGSSASYTLDSGFVPIIAQSFQQNVASTPTPTPASTPTATPVPNVWDAPSTSGWGLVALAVGMLVVLLITLRLTSGSRRAARP